MYLSVLQGNFLVKLETDKADPSGVGGVALEEGASALNRSDRSRSHVDLPAAGT